MIEHVGILYGIMGNEIDLQWGHKVRICRPLLLQFDYYCCHLSIVNPSILHRSTSESMALQCFTQSSKKQQRPVRQEERKVSLPAGRASWV